MPSLLSTRDGLGFEEIGQTGSQLSDIWVTGSIISQDMISGANLYATTAMQAPTIVATTAISGLRVLTGSFIGAVHSGVTALFTNVTASTGLSGTNLNVTTAVATTFSGAQMVLTGSANAVTINASTSFSGPTIALDTALIAGSIQSTLTYGTPGSPFFQGDVFRTLAETIITGGMWVTISGAAGGAAMLARAAAASTQGPIGVATATAGSNTLVSVLVRGLTYLTADATISNGQTIGMGAGGALNTAIADGAGSGARGVAIAGAGSNSVVLVYLW